MEPEANFYEEFKRLHPKPYFSFPDIPDYKGYSFEKLNIENFKQLYLLFEDDESNLLMKGLRITKKPKIMLLMLLFAELTHQNMAVKIGFSNYLVKNMWA